MRNMGWIGCALVSMITACASDASQFQRGTNLDEKDAGVTPTAPGSSGTAKPEPSASAGNQTTTPPLVIRTLDGGRQLPDASPPTTDAACAVETRSADPVPLDMVIAMDQSGSMKETVAGGRKWDLLVAALGSFLRDPASAGIGVGLIYFGIPATTSNPNTMAVSCNPADYASPVVGVSALPDNATPLLASLQSHTPMGGTPTRPALEGTATYARNWLAQHPGHRVVIVVATDGEPNDCASSVEAVANVARQAATDTIATYVIGVGSSLGNLDQIARAGNTNRAYLVDTTSNTTQSFLAAMNAIRNEAALPCQYSVPSPDQAQAGQDLDYDKVNVAYSTQAPAGTGVTDSGRPTDSSIDDPDNATRPNDRTTTMLLRTASAASCSTSTTEWYYDDPVQPKTINLCPATCGAVKRDINGRVEVLIGCATRTVPVH